MLAVVADVTAYSDLENFIQSTVQLYGGIDILVNNAGRSSAAKFDTVPDDEWDYDMRLKLFSAIKCCQLAIPYLRRAGRGPHSEHHNSWGQAAASGLGADLG